MAYCVRLSAFDKLIYKWVSVVELGIHTQTLYFVSDFESSLRIHSGYRVEISDLTFQFQFFTKLDLSPRSSPYTPQLQKMKIRTPNNRKIQRIQNTLNKNRTRKIAKDTKSQHKKANRQTVCRNQYIQNPQTTQPKNVDPACKNMRIPRTW